MATKEESSMSLVLHAGFVEAGVEALTDFMMTPDSLTKEWKQVSRRAGPFSGERKKQLFSTIRAGSIFCDPVRTRDFAEGITRKIDRRLLELLDLFETYPWRYAPFEIRSLLDEGLLDIRLEGRREILFSPKAVSEKKKGSERLLGLLFFNGKCMQSWGEIVPLDSFFEEDLHYMAGESTPEVYANEGVEASIIASPLPFLLLKLFASLPSPLLHGELARPCVSSIHAAGFTLKDIEHCRCRTEALHRGNMHRISLGSDYSIRPPTLYFDQRQDTLFLTALTLEGYRKARMALQEVAEFPEKPQRMVSGIMQYAVYELLGKNPPWMELDRCFLPGKDSRKGVSELERMEAAVYHCVETGKEVLPEVVSEQSGVDLISARIFLEGLRSIITGTPEGLSYTRQRPGVNGATGSGRQAA